MPGSTQAKQALLLAMRRLPTPEAHPLRERIDWRPQPRQAEFLQACGLLDWYLHDGQPQPAAARLVGYGGAAGGGKSDAGLVMLACACYAWPGLKAAMFRRTYEELEGADGVIQRSLELFHPLGEYNQTSHRWTFDNGSHLYFRHLHLDKDKYKYQSQAFGVIDIDEATHFPWLLIDYLLTRNRSTVGGLVPFTAMQSNPGNVGHVWFSQLFDVHDLSGGEQGPHEQVKDRLTPNERKEMVLFIPARLEDNQVLMSKDPDYASKLEARSPELVEALRHGNWQALAGAAFGQWRRERHVIDPVELPKQWPRWRALDWGYSNPMCCLWLCRDLDSGRVYVYRELYQTGLHEGQQAKLIREMTPPSENVMLTYADPSMWGSKTTSQGVTSSAQEYGLQGVQLWPADNARLNGKRKIDRVLGNLADGKPGLLVFSNCANLIRTLPALVRDAVDVEDVDTHMEDHAYDALRYGLTNFLEPAPQHEKRAGMQKAQEALNKIL